MTYLSYEIELDRSDDLFSLIRPIEMYQRFLIALSTQAKSSNFSKVYDPNSGKIHPNLIVRFKVLDDNQAKKIIEKVAGDIAGEGKLRIFVGPSTWEESDDVWVKAHEAASECALRLAQLMTRKDSELSLDSVRKRSDWDTFIVQLTLKILDISGFRVFIRREYRKRFAIQERELDKISNDLASVWWNKAPVNGPEGIDAFIHLFFNCTASSPTTAEELFQMFASGSAVYKSIFDMRKLVSVKA